MGVEAAGFELTTMRMRDGHLASTATADLMRNDAFFMGIKKSLPI